MEDEDIGDFRLMISDLTNFPAIGNWQWEIGNQAR